MQYDDMVSAGCHAPLADDNLGVRRRGLHSRTASASQSGSSSSGGSSWGGAGVSSDSSRSSGGRRVNFDVAEVEAAARQKRAEHALKLNSLVRSTVDQLNAAPGGPKGVASTTGAGGGDRTLAPNAKRRPPRIQLDTVVAAASSGVAITSEGAPATAASATAASAEAVLMASTFDGDLLSPPLQNARVATAEFVRAVRTLER